MLVSAFCHGSVVSKQFWLCTLSVKYFERTHPIYVYLFINYIRVLLYLSIM